MKPLITISEAIRTSQLDKLFQAFLNEAGPQTFTPSSGKIEKCIRNRRYAGIYYEEESDDEDVKVLSGFRLIEPLVFGKGYRSADGHVSHVNDFYLRAYVIKESAKAENKTLRKITRKSVSKSKRVPYFRLFKFDRITMWEDIRFKIPESRAGYNPDDEMIAEILQAAKF